MVDSKETPVEEVALEEPQVEANEEVKTDPSILADSLYKAVKDPNAHLAETQEGNTEFVTLNIITSDVGKVITRALEVEGSGVLIRTEAISNSLEIRVSTAFIPDAFINKDNNICYSKSMNR